MRTVSDYAWVTIVWIVCYATSLPGQDIATLIDALGDANLRYGASRALTQHGGAATPLLGAVLKEGPVDQRIWSAYTLGEIGEHASPAIDRLRASLDSDALALRVAAAEALGKIGRATPDGIDSSCLQSIAKLLSDEQLDVRRAALNALSRIGEPAASAAEPAIELLKDSRLRAEAKAVLISMGEAAAKAMTSALDDDEVRWDVARILRQVTPRQAKAFQLDSPTERDVAALRGVLLDASRLEADHTLVAKELATLGASGWEVLVATLEQAEASPSAAAIASAAFQFAGSEAVAQLLPLLKSPQSATRRAAANALRHMCESAGDAAKSLAALLNDAEHDVRLSAAQALDAMGSGAAPAVDELIQTMLDEKQREPTRQWAILALVNTLPATREVVIPAIVKASKNKANYGVSSLASQQLKKFEAAN